MRLGCEKECNRRSQMDERNSEKWIHLFGIRERLHPIPKKCQRTKHDSDYE